MFKRFSLNSKTHVKLTISVADCGKYKKTESVNNFTTKRLSGNWMELRLGICSKIFSIY